MTDGEARLLQLFEELGLAATTHEHPPVATVAEAEAHWSAIGARPVKNLFLKDAGGTFWLVVADTAERTDLKALPERIGSKRLRFAAPDDLLARLGVTPGAASPLAVVNDRGGEVRVVLDQRLAGEAPLALHPLRNTATVALAFDELVAFLSAAGHAPRMVEV